MRTPDRRRALEVARVLLGCQAYAASSDEAIAWWSVWLDQTHAAGFPLDSLEVAASAHARRLELAQWGSRDLLDNLDRMLATHDVSEPEREQLFSVTTMASRRELQVGTWAAQLPDGFEGGWCVRGELDLSFTRAIVGETAIDVLARVYDQFSLETVTRLSRAVAHEAGSWDVEIPLGATPLEYAWNATMDALGMPDASPALEHWLAQPSAAHAGVVPALVARFAGDAIVAVRLVVPVASPTELAAALVGAGIEESRDRHLAAIAGALDAQPRAAVLVRDGDGFDLELVC